MKLLLQYEYNLLPYVSYAYGNATLLVAVAISAYREKYYDRNILLKKILFECLFTLGKSSCLPNTEIKNIF